MMNLGDQFDVLGSAVRIVIVGSVLTFTGTGCATNTTQTAERWQELWADRLTTYTQNIDAYEAEVSQSYDQVTRTVANNPNQHEALVSSIEGVANKERQLAKLQGQRTMLVRFGEFLNSSPTWNMLTAWVGDQAQRLQSLDENSQRRIQQFLSRLTDTETPYPTWTTDYVALWRERGLLEGASDELIRVAREVDAYQTDMQQARQADLERQRRVSAALYALGQSMQQYAYQQQMINALNRPRSCVNYGYTITCY